jgi:hypothetical protein
MRQRWSFMTGVVLAVAVGAAGCGAASTGISLSIQPQSIAATPTRGGVFAAAWDVVLADMTGVGGTLESLEAAVDGAAVTFTGAGSSAAVPVEPASLALAPFDRRIYHQSGAFALPAGGTGGALLVTARFRAEDGVVHTATAQARVTVQ